MREQGVQKMIPCEPEPDRRSSICGQTPTFRPMPRAFAIRTRIASFTAVVLLAAGCASAGTVVAPTPEPGALTMTGESPPTATDTIYDVVIRNGRVLDGAGNPW